VLRAEEIGIEPVILITETKASPSLTAFARQHEVAEVRLDPISRDAFENDLSRALIAARADLVSLTFDRIVPPAIVEAFRGRMINVHPGLLPAYPGRRAIERLIESGALFGGATIHEVTDNIDGGPIVAQAVVATIPGDTVETYGARMYALLEPMYLDVLRWYVAGSVVHDDAGRVVVRGAEYGTLPVSPRMHG
jgi:phosphoribosylglycinamide formyltransferase-1